MGRRGHRIAGPGPAGVGVALAGKRLDKRDYRVWVLCGDSEMAEGSVWTALDKASHYALSNLTVIVEVNRLGQRGPTELGRDLETYRQRVEAFGCLAIVIDGHDLDQIDRAYAVAEAADQPGVILAKTRKGDGGGKSRTRTAGSASRCPRRWPTGPTGAWAARATCASRRIRERDTAWP